MMMCGICGHDVDHDLIDRRDTGDFHRACLESLRTAGVALANCASEQADCRMCSEHIAKGAPLVEFFGLDCVAHLRCFFGTTNGRTRSVGAGAARLSVVERGRLLRERSDALVALSRRLLAARLAGYPRIAV